MGGGRLMVRERQPVRHAPLVPIRPNLGWVRRAASSGRRLRAGPDLLGAQGGEVPERTTPDVANEAILTVWLPTTR